MPVLRFLPAQLALLVLAAHFFRAGLVALVPVCLGLVLLTFVRFPWVPGVTAVALLLASAEWLRTLFVLAGERVVAGQPYTRLAVILLAVAIATLLSAWPLRSGTVRRWYAGDQSGR